MPTHIKKLIQSEKAARGFLLRYCRAASCLCPRCCHDQKAYRLADRRLRCPRCEYTYHELTGRWINRGALSSRQWVLLLHLFAQNFTIRAIAHWLRISPNTATRAVTTLRTAIAARSPDCLSLIDSGLNTPACIDYPVFAIDKATWPLRVRHCQSNRPMDLLQLPVPMYRWRNIVFTGPSSGCEGYVFCDDPSLRRDLPFKPSGQPRPDMAGGFWIFLIQACSRFNGITPRRFHLYIKEMELRFNHTPSALFHLMASCLCDFTPDCASPTPCSKCRKRLRIHPPSLLSLLDSPDPETCLAG